MSDKAETLSFSIFQSLVRSPARMLGSVFLNGQSSRPLPDLAEFDVGILIPYRTVQKWAQTGAETDQSSAAERVESPKRVEAQSLSFAAHHVRSSHTSAHRSTTFIQLPRDGTKLRTSSGLPINSCPGVICAFLVRDNLFSLSSLSGLHSASVYGIWLWRSQGYHITFGEELWLRRLGINQQSLLGCCGFLRFRLARLFP